MARSRESQTDRPIERRTWLLLAAAVLGPLGVAAVLFALDVPLGKPGKFAYLYSEFVSERLARVPAAMLQGLGIGIGVWLAASGERRRRRLGALLVALGTVAVAHWSYTALPYHQRQHFMNMQSPSHDGAFLLEAFEFESRERYLARFPERVRTPPEEMKGTRVISNPPGATLLAVGVRRTIGAWPGLGRLIAATFAHEKIESPEMRALVVVSFGFAWALAGVWVLAAPILYLLGRLFLPRAAAAALAVCCTISPMTILFVPGKDAAQLLTVALPLGLWLAAVRRGWRWAAFLAGAAAVLSTMVSLVHVWIGVIVVGACLMHAVRGGGQLGRFAGRVCAPAVLGALLTVGVLWAAFDWNVVATVLATARSQAEVTRGPEAMPLVWQVLGIPLFLLFAGPALWSCGLWLARDRLVDDDARLGRTLAGGAALVMILTVGFTNIETPRLWIAFVPLLLLGSALQLRVFREPGRRAAVLLAVLVGVQVAASALHWSVMDMREAEMRLDETSGPARLFQ